MKTVIKIGLLTSLVLMFHMSNANHLNGWWVSNQNQRIEIIVKDHRLLISSPKYRQTEVFMPLQGRHAYRNPSGEQLILLGEDKLEMRDRHGMDRTLYYKENSYRPHHDQNPNWDREPGQYMVENCEGQWYNPSTGIRLQIDDKRHHLKVRFQRDRWTSFYQQQRGRYFADDRGNTLTIDRNNIIYRSVLGDLTMVFTRGEGVNSGNSPFFEEYSRHYRWN